jgi:PBP1b-binding outer membrane lipoprotein LpoB
MKLIKGLLAIALVSLIAVSCKEAKEEKVEDSKATTEEVATDDKTDVATTEESTSDTPSFDNADVQAYVDSYESYIEEYAKVAESKDMSKMADLGNKGAELGKKAQDAMKNLTGDDAKKLTEYMTAKSKEIQALTAKMTAK